MPEEKKEKIKFPLKTDSSQAKKTSFLNQSRLGAGQSMGISKAVEFIKEMIGKEGDIVKANKIDKGWEVEVEVIEQSEYMKRIGIPKPVYDKNIYRVMLDQNFEMMSYERKSQKPSGGSAE